jgi:hypothetical protein
MTPIAGQKVIDSPKGKWYDYKNGAVAQLGARLTGSQKVTGSNPVSSIILFCHRKRRT